MAKAKPSDPLPSWKDGATKAAILDFVARVTDPESPEHVHPDDRVAVFDNDGTLWCEMPLPVQAYFVEDRLRALAPSHPEWKTAEPYHSVLAGDHRAVVAQGLKGAAEIVMATHAGMTTDEFEAMVRGWLAKARHPTLGRHFTECVYAPMLELLALLRARRFDTFIVSGGGVEFMRVFADEVYGVPPQRVIGSSIRTHFEERDGGPVLVRDPTLDHFDDGPGKPVAIQKHVGRRPILAVGNSDGDREMLMWTTVGRGDAEPVLGVLVHHTDADREFAYDRQHVLSGRLDRALDAADENGWVVADVKDDWTTVFPPAVTA